MENTRNKYVPNEIEPKWQKKWEESRLFSPDLDSAKKPFYNLMMFPYPSAEGMHVGNMYAFTGSDIYGRFKRMQGYDVFEPIGLDGFGIHSENYAIKVGRHPKEQARLSEQNFYRQLRATGNAYDWERKVETYDPSYYKWTQWLFVQLFKSGLAYRKKASVNFCPSCKTVLSDEQVIKQVKSTRLAEALAKRAVQNPKVQKETQEEIIVNVCERCGTEVEKRELEQWFFRITNYADRLLNNLTQIDWAEKVKIAQREWIGRSEGAKIRFKIHPDLIGIQEIEVFTTRQDTLYGATFLVLAPEHPVVVSLLNSKFNPSTSLRTRIQSSKLKEIEDYVEQAKKKTEQDRKAKEREKTGVFTGFYGINPLNQEEIPIWISDYALMEYGTGALFGDAHDERDVEFANKYKIPLKPTLITGDKEKDKRIMSLAECFTGYGTLVNSGPFTNFTSQEALKKVAEWLEEKGAGGPEVAYHLRDWLISRQRYWGPPIPMIYCEACAGQGRSWFSTKEAKEQHDLRFIPIKSGFKNKDLSRLNRDLRNKNHQSSIINHQSIEMAGWFPVPEGQLPVELPFIEDYRPLGIGKSPLANHPEFYKVACPECGAAARRETDVSDTFLDSAWYFFRYTSTKDTTCPWKPERAGKWLPVTMYIGGAEHSVLHLLYARFITMVFADLGLISHFEEPFKRFYAHGLLIKEGAKMSKSKGNVIVPDAYIRKFGADTLRMYLMFLGPFSQGGDFYDTALEGMFRFLKRVWTLIHDKKNSMENKNDSGRSLFGSNEAYVFMNKTIKRVKDDIESLRYNTAIAALMEYYNFLSNQEYIAIEEFRNLLKLLSPFAPYIAEELWEYIGGKFSIHQELFPKFNQNALKSFHRTIAIQINGKLRDTVIVTGQASKNKNIIEQVAKESDKVKKHLEGKKIKKVVYVEGKIINFVTS